jgi:hypothetical protein
MNSIIGYILSAIGLGVVLTSEKIVLFLAKYFQIKLAIIIAAGIALILLGIIILMNPSNNKGKISQASEEVPIYEGEGKHRKIVGYRKA